MAAVVGPVWPMTEPVRVNYNDTLSNLDIAEYHTRIPSNDLENNFYFHSLHGHVITGYFNILANKSLDILYK